MRGRSLVSVLLLLAPVFAFAGDRLIVAVASNFRVTAEQLADTFSHRSGILVDIASGSTGKLYGQILNGAPFDVFLAADAERPVRLEQAGAAVANSRRTYALGTLVLWSRDPAFSGADCSVYLRRLGKRKLSIANPATAPYGRAAEQFLRQSGHWPAVRDSLVLGENISQTLQFVASGNAGMGLIAASQLHMTQLPRASCTQAIPDSSHDPIEQQAVLLSASKSPRKAQLFLDFLHSVQGCAIIRAHGYQLPEASPCR